MLRAPAARIRCKHRTRGDRCWILLQDNEGFPSVLVMGHLTGGVDYPVVFRGAEAIAIGVLQRHAILLEGAPLVPDAAVGAQQTPRPQHWQFLVPLEHPASCHGRPLQGGRKKFRSRLAGRVCHQSRTPVVILKKVCCSTLLRRDRCRQWATTDGGTNRGALRGQAELTHD